MMGREKIDLLCLSEMCNFSQFFRTLEAYFSGRGTNFKKVPDTFMENYEKPGQIAFLSDPVASEFIPYEKKKNSYYEIP